MAVVAKWMCDRDNTMFDSKKEADAYDKMLELAEQFSALLQAKVISVDESQAEEFGIFMARNKEQIVKACKGDPTLLEGLLEPAVQDNVTAIACKDPAGTGTWFALCRWPCRPRPVPSVPRSERRCPGPLCTSS